MEIIKKIMLSKVVLKRENAFLKIMERGMIILKIKII